MIKVNLARSRTQSGVNQTESTNFTIDSGSGDSSEQRVALRNLFLLFVGVLLLIVYERFTVFNLNDSNLLIGNELTQIEQQLEATKANLEQHKASETEAKALEDKLSIIKKLSRIRLREVKALDYIQEIIPQKIWLRSLTFDHEIVRISGYSMLDEDLSNFIQVMDRSSFFQSVLLTQANEVASKSGNYKQFDISARLEMTE